MTDEQKINLAISHFKRSQVSGVKFQEKLKAGAYANPGATEWGKGFAALGRDPSGKPLPAPPPPPPAAGGRYGSKAAAGPFAGGGLMLGSNSDVWNQALDEVAHGLRCVAVIPGTPLSRFEDANGTRLVKVVLWQPPEHAADLASPAGYDGYVGQAENQAEFDQAVANIAKVRAALGPHFPCGIVANWWGYGRYPAGVVALVELYWNTRGVGVDNGILIHYIEQGAAAVVAVPGVWSGDVPDQEAAALYAGLPADLPGVMGYAGESLVTEASRATLHDLWRRM